MAKLMDVLVAEKSVKVTLFTGPDDPDLPKHVKALPMGTRSRWVNSYNWGVQDLKDNKAAEEQADMYTSMSVEELFDAGILNRKEDATPVPAPTLSSQGTDRVQVQSSSQASWVDRFKEAVGIGKPAPAQAEPIKPGVFSVYKGDDGRWRVFTVYSNNFKDSHKQFVRETAHQEYAEAAESGNALYPDLHLWHGGPDTKWGTIETVSVVGGFAIAGGVVDEGKEHVAIALKEMADKNELAVSYGFFGLLAPDESYLLYRPFEISPLPATQESNPWTVMDFKENSMAFSDKKKDWLKSNFKMTDDQITAAEKSFENMGSALKAAGIEYKEGAGETPAPPPSPTPPPQPTPPDPPPTPPTPTPPAPQATTEVPDSDGGLMPQMAAMAKAIEGLGQGIQAIAKEVVALKQAAPAATAAAAEDQILARIAGSPGFSAARSATTVAPAMKEAADDWFAPILGKVIDVDAVNGIMGGPSVAAVQQAAAAAVTGASGEVK